MKLACLFNRHRPPGRRARMWKDTFVSECKDCRRPIIRVGPGQWRRHKVRAEPVNGE